MMMMMLLFKPSEFHSEASGGGIGKIARKSQKRVLST